MKNGNLIKFAAAILSVGMIGSMSVTAFASNVDTQQTTVIEAPDTNTFTKDGTDSADVNYVRPTINIVKSDLGDGYRWDVYFDYGQNPEGVRVELIDMSEPTVDGVPGYGASIFGFQDFSFSCMKDKMTEDHTVVVSYTFGVFNGTGFGVPMVDSFTVTQDVFIPAEVPDVPDTETPDTETPDTETPDTEISDTEESDTETPDTEVPDTETPDTGIGGSGNETGVPDSDTDGSLNETDGLDTDVSGNETESSDMDSSNTETSDTETTITDSNSTGGNGTGNINSTNQTANNTKLDAPETGDESPVIPLIGTGIGSLGLALIALFKKIKQ